MYSDEDYSDNNEDYYVNDREFEKDTQTASPKNYSVLTMDNIRQRQADDVASVSSFLSIPPSSAAILLRHHRWNQDSVQDAWFSDENQTRKSTGLMIHCSSYKPHSRNTFKCRICFERYKHSHGAHAGCGHTFCRKCWRSYIRVSIEGGPGCLSLRCPKPSCVAAVDRDMVHKLCEDREKDKYVNYLLRSYIEGNMKTKWCPAPGCEMAVEFEDAGNIGGDGYDVVCKCLHGFCWNCSEEAHRPVDCDTVAKWIDKNSSDGENGSWILAHTKPCPKCKRAIEKNSGCMHMTCSEPCKYQFCWICLGPWSEHRDCYNCNRYTQETRAMEKSSHKGHKSLMRYMHYYERWVANEKSRKKASEDLFNFEALNVEVLQLLLQKDSVTEFEFIKEAWEQIIECRRALKWSYAYGYYIPKKEKAKKYFFEFLQGQAELWLERLHHCAEKDLKGFLEGKPKEEFWNFRQKLRGLTKSTHTYFGDLAKALENGLSEVYSYYNSTHEKAQRKREREHGLSDLDQDGDQKRRC